MMVILTQLQKINYKYNKLPRESNIKIAKFEAPRDFIIKK